MPDTTTPAPAIQEQETTLRAMAEARGWTYRVGTTAPFAIVDQTGKVVFGVWDRRELGTLIDALERDYPTPKSP